MKITQFNPLTSVAPGDLLPVVDIDDITMASTGTTKKATIGNLGGLLNDRGAIQASTAYNPGDMVAYQGQRVLITQVTTSTAWTAWNSPPTLPAGTYIPITSQAVYYAEDWGVVLDGVTDNGPALNRALMFMWGSGKGGFLVLPTGYEINGSICGVSSTVIIPPTCFIVGGGMEVSCIRANAGMNADVVQFMTNNSATQAAIISAATGATVPASSLRNAFYAGLMNVTIHGSAVVQGAGQYNYGVNLTTSPQSTSAGTDPDFDPYNLLCNVEIRSCTGDGLYHFGRGGLRVHNVLCRYNAGWGAVTSFDSLYTGCNFGENGIGGLYQSYSSTDGAANKAYNNGQNAQWVASTAYSAKTPVMYNGAMYRSINAVTSATPPPSDATNWAAVASTAPGFWGNGFVWDSNVKEAAWTSCDAQQNSASNFVLNGCAGVNIHGVSSQPGFQATSNPSDWASLDVRGAAGCMADIVYGTLASKIYALRVTGTATRNSIRMTGDASYAAILSPDTVPLAGNRVEIDSKLLASSILLPSAVQTVVSSGTITTSGPGVARVTATAAVAGVVLAAGTAQGQQLTIINESAFSITMAASGTSNVASGISDVISALHGATYTWNGSLWYRL